MDCRNNLYLFEQFEQYLQPVNTEDEVRDKGQLLIDFQHLAVFNAGLAAWIEKNYLEVQPILCSIAKNYYQRLYQIDIKSISVCFQNVPTEISMSEISTKYIGMLVSIEGRCINQSTIKYEVDQAVYRCPRCAGIVRNAMYSKKFTKLKCRACQTHKYEFDSTASTYISIQNVIVQQSDVAPKKEARRIDITIRNPELNKPSLGKNYKFFGTVTCQLIEDNNLNGEFEVAKMEHRLSFIADYIQVSDDLPISTQDTSINDEMFNDKNLLDNIISSMFPNFFGFREVKFALLLQAIGGVSKITQDNIRLRGDIHVLLIGDASTGKSNLKKMALNFWEVAVETCGLGTSDAGLTAGIVTNENTGENEIRAGAVKQAHTGLCCIDEFDKLPTSTHNMLHEVMEQQTISINKAGNMAKFDCHTSILATGNPRHGMLDFSLKPDQNTNIKPPLMSRFDLIFYMSGTLANDRAIATNIINHRCGIGPSSETPYTVSEIKSYILHCRKLKPILTEETTKFIHGNYEQFIKDEDCVSRTLESVIRLSEAFAKFERANTVLVSHVEKILGFLQYAHTYFSAI